MKVLFLIGSESEKKYLKPIITLFNEKKVIVEFVVFKWKNKTQSDCAQEIITKCRGKDLDSFYIFGFSISALIAILVASKTKVKGLILTSPTPLFSDTIFPKRITKYLGKKRIAVAKSTKIIDLKLNTNKIFLFIGEHEDNEILKQSKALAITENKINLKIVKNTGHSFSTPEMITALRKIIA